MLNFNGPSLGYAVGESQTFLRRVIFNPDLVPSEGWSLACARSTGYFHIIAQVRNIGVGDVTAAMLPFTVTLDGTQDGAVVPGTHHEFSVTTPVLPDNVAMVDNATIGLSTDAFFDLMEPAIQADGSVTVRMSVDVNNNVAEEPAGGEENNVREQATVCGVGGSGGGAEEIAPPSPGDEKKGKGKKEYKKKNLFKKKIVLKKKPLFPKKKK